MTTFTAQFQKNQEITTIDVEKIKSFVRQTDYFCNPENEVATIIDVENFGWTQQKRVIRYGEIFIVDLVGRQYWLVRLSKKQHWTPDKKRRTKCEPIACISDDVGRDFGTNWRNGYFSIPDDVVISAYMRDGLNAKIKR